MFRAVIASFVIPSGQAKILIECKSPKVNLSQDTLDQAGIYNQNLNAPYFWISNGHSNFIYHINFTEKSYERIDEPPAADEL